MKIRIWHQLALVLLTTMAVVIAVTFVLAQLNFRHGFSGYLKEQEQRYIQLLSERLIDDYQQSGNWEFVRNKPRVWRLILRESFKIDQPPFSPAHRRHEEAREHRQADHDHKPKYPPGLRHALLDKDKHSVIGFINEGPSIHDHALVLNGETIGFLRVRSVSGFTNQLDQRFVQSQLHAYIVIAIIALLLSLIAAWFLSRYFRRRISQLTGIANDLTAGKFDQRIAITHHDELADLGNSFNVLADTLEKNRQSQKQWIADISHELRTPLSILSGELEALQDGIRPLNQTAVQSLAGETSHLRRLVDDLYQLSLSDLGRLNYHRSKIELTTIVQRVIDQYRPRIAEHGLTLETEIDQQAIFISADEQRLVQLFSNLLDNAVKYTDSGGRLLITCEQQQHVAVIQFEDSSPAVPAASLPSIFDRLYRVEVSRNRRTGGAGLGLAIAASIVEAHQGQIEASASDLGGLKLVIHLPVEKTNA